MSIVVHSVFVLHNKDETSDRVVDNKLSVSRLWSSRGDIGLLSLNQRIYILISLQKPSQISVSGTIVDPVDIGQAPERLPN